MVKDNIGSSGNHFFPFIFTLFVFIALMNVFGVFPYTFAPTAHIIVTFGLSLSIFIGCTILGLINFRSDFFAMFMPAGSPLVLAPFLVIIEFVSYLAKAISLGVRLAANITAGHLLFSILSGFA
jgi:ATP synthase subunit 6